MGRKTVIFNLLLLLFSTHAYGVGQIPVGFMAGRTAGCTASGGTLSYDGAYTVHTFTSSGNFTITSGSCTLEIEVIGGGASGGGGGGGGGAGRYYRASVGTYTSASCGGDGVCPVTVGAKGAAQGNGLSGQAGSASVFTGDTTYSMPGGGWGSASTDGGSGGSGGGGQSGGLGGTATAGTGANGVGYDGGTGGTLSTDDGGGGGGASSAGSNATASAGGNGGACINSDITQTGVNVCKAGGGGGGSEDGGTAGTGGGGGASDGKTSTAGNTVPADACSQANSGSGGGGGGMNGSGGSGGAGCDGVVIVRHL